MVLQKEPKLELMDDNFRKITATNLKVNVNLKTLTEGEIKAIITNDKVIENIDEVLWYLIDDYSDIYSWIK